MDLVVMEYRLKQWIPIFEAQATSGLTKAEWCRQNDIKRIAFFKWKRKLQDFLIEKNDRELYDQESNAQMLMSGPRFVEISPGSNAMQPIYRESFGKKKTSSSSSVISIRYGKFTIDLHNDVNEQLLSKVMRVINDVN